MRRPFPGRGQRLCGGQRGAAALPGTQSSRPPQAPESPGCRQGWERLDCRSPRRYSPGPPGNLQVFPWAQEVRPQTFRHAWDKALNSAQIQKKYPMHVNEGSWRGQVLPVKRTLTLGSCCCAAILGRMWGHPFLPAPGAHLTPLPVLCQAAPAPTGALGCCQPCSPPARLCGQAGQPVWEARLVSGGISPAALQAQMLPPSTNAVPHAHPTCAQGETPRDARGDGAARGRCPHCRQGVQAAGHHAAGSAKAGQAKRSKIPRGKLCSAPASKGLSSLHKPPRSPGLLCPLLLLRPPRAGLVPKSEPANQQLPAAAALRLP